jgi:hypothetical protein
MATHLLLGCSLRLSFLTSRPGLLLLLRLCLLRLLPSLSSFLHLLLVVVWGRVGLLLLLLLLLLFLPVPTGGLLLGCFGLLLLSTLLMLLPLAAASALLLLPRASSRMRSVLALLEALPGGGISVRAAARLSAPTPATAAVCLSAALPFEIAAVPG